MTIPAANPPPPAGVSRGVVCLAGAGIVLAALAAYAGSLAGPFLFDDLASIRDNPTIRHLWPLGKVLIPPAEAGAGGRPILNLSFALNYAFGGLNVWGYHAINLLIHALAGLTLFGIVRRTLEKMGTARPHLPTMLAFIVALIWTVHPLQTEAVTYVSQRAESLMGLFYLLTLYCFIRYAERAGRGGWAWLSVGACFLGIATKEVIVTVPLIVLLYDRTFVSGAFGEAWRRHRGYYAGLACSWLLLALSIPNVQKRGVGFGLGGSWWNYALTESEVIVSYLRLAIWPHPLVFDYGMGLVPLNGTVLPFVAIVLLLLATAGYALLRSAKRSPGGQALGFAGVWIFMTLAPTSSVVAVAGQPMAEHRMYLPLAGVIALVVGGGYALFRSRRAQNLFLLLLLGVAIAFGFLTVRRNAIYRSEVSLWADTAAQRPTNGRAQNELGVALEHSGRLAEAIDHYREAVRLQPALAESHQNLGAALLKLGRFPEAVAECQEALRLRPHQPEAHFNLGVAWQAAGQTSAAIAEFSRALQLRPGYPDAEYNLGAALAGLGQMAEAIGHYEAALHLEPEDTDVRYDLANALLGVGRRTEAIGQFEAVLRQSPGDAAAHNNLGIALAESGRLPEAIAQFAEAVRLKPDYVQARNNLSRALASEEPAVGR